MQGQGDRVTNLRLVDGAADTPARTGSAPRPSTRVRSTRRRRAFGKIAKQRSGRYQASYLGENGERYLAPVTFETKGDADTWLSMRRAELEEHRWRPPDPQPAETPTLRDYSEIWIERRRTRDGQPLKPRTKDLYRILLDKQILPTLDDRHLGPTSPPTTSTTGTRCCCPLLRPGGHTPTRCCRPSCAAPARAAVR